MGKPSSRAAVERDLKAWDKAGIAYNRACNQNKPFLTCERLRIKADEASDRMLAHFYPDKWNPKIGDRVIKASGYKYPGVIVSVFVTTAGLQRCVVECTVQGCAGMLHIFNADQLRCVK